jgi:DNA polymerase-3 subunit alpha (Gram-positive type)
MGATAADSLEEACKHGPFCSKEEVRERGKISQTILDKMTELGILGDLPDTNQFSLFDLGLQ